MGQLIETALRAETSSYVYAALIAFLSYWLVSSIWSYWRLRQFDGPPLAAWTFLWFTNAAMSGKTHLYLSEVCTKYGPLARIGPNMLVTSDEELYKRINTPRSGYYKDHFYKAFKFGAEVDNVLSETDNEKHTYLRKRIAPGYSGKDNKALEPDTDLVIWALIDSIKKRYISKGSVLKPMDLAIQLQYAALDIITSLSFGKALGFVTSDSDMHEYIGTMNSNFPAMNFVSAVPLLNRLLCVPWIQRIMAPSTKDRIGMGKVKAVSTEILTKRYHDFKTEIGMEKNQRSDMTASFIAHNLSLTEITDGALLNIIAGSDTTVTVLRTGLLSILTNPRIFKRLQDECDAANVPKNQIISQSRALELPYLQACIKEALRFNPAATGLLPRVVPPQGDYYNGKFIPGGTAIGQCAWNLHRLNYDAYGADANIFRPERWTEAAEEAIQTGNRTRLERMERAQELVFAYGEFKCLGYRIALMELNKIWFELLRRFEFGLMNSLTPMEKNLNYGLFLQEGLWVRVEERDSES